QDYPDIRQRYVDHADPDFSLTLRQLMADVVTRFEDLMATPFFQQNGPLLMKFIAYFEKTWIGTPIGGGRDRPTYTVDKWNQYHATLNGLPKTNNAIEGWHKAFADCVEAIHPTIW